MDGYIMNYFVIQIRTGNEKQFLEIANKISALRKMRFIWLRKMTDHKKQGRIKTALVSLFPGYLFIESETILGEEIKLIKSITGFIHFLRDNQHIDPLSFQDRELVSHFLSFGEVVGKSEAFFDDQNRIRIVAGPLKGLEGSIVKVDRRKKRVKVKLDLYEDSLLINLDFELIGRSETKEEE
jgi:transcriptional antiterminator NusG